MSPIGDVVPFAVFTEYRNRRLRGAAATSVRSSSDIPLPSSDNRDGIDTSFAQDETAPNVLPDNGRSLS